MAGRFELKEIAPVRVPGTQVGYPQIPLDMASDGLSNGTVSFRPILFLLIHILQCSKIGLIHMQQQNA